MKSNDFKDFIKQKRNNDFIKPYDLAYHSFFHLNLNKKSQNYFLKNASSIVENMRKKCWDNFSIAEIEFSKMIYQELSNKIDYTGLSNKESVKKFIDLHINHFYELSLSNTQSRRSRAGTEFEAIIELLFIGAGILIDSQGFLSSSFFEENKLGKAVDFVSPGVLEYSILKRSCSLISCKTSLRERWAEVIEEKERTGASEIFLATLDDKISNNTLKILNDKNVIPVVTKQIKNKYYTSNRNVITFEELLNLIKEKNKYWTYEMYSPENLEQRIEVIEKQIEKHTSLNHPHISNFYYNIKASLSNLPEPKKFIHNKNFRHIKNSG